MFGNAEAYERFMGRWSRLVAPRLVDFADLPEGGRALDVGSGTGSLAFTIAGRMAGTQVLGIDPSKEYVAYAEDKNPIRDRIRFQVGDSQQLQFPNGSFDSASSLLVFNFIPDSKKALMELCRVVKPGGIIAAAVWDYGSGMRMLRTFWDAVVSLDPEAETLDERHMPLCRPGELSALWAQAGLEDIREQPLDVTMRFESFADYWDPFLLGQGPAGAYLGRLDCGGVERVRDEVSRRLSLPGGTTPFSLQARAWAVRGAGPGA